MKKIRLLALLLALVMVFSLAACGNDGNPTGSSNPGTSDKPSSDPKPSDKTGDDPAPSDDPTGGLDVTKSDFFGPIYDEWSDMTDDELFQKALEEVKDGSEINIYATSSKMTKVKDDFEEQFPGLIVNIMDMDQDEVLQKCELEADSGNILGDVLQAKDVNGSVFFDFYEEGFCSAYYPKDISAKIDEDLLRYGYPLYASQSFWYYNTEAFPDGQPVTNWWQIVEHNDDGSQKYRLFTKEIGTETSYLSLFASFIVNADQMGQAYKDLYGTDLEYTYDASGFDGVPANNAGIEYLWRFSQMKMTFIGDGDELVLAVHNSTKDDPALCLASGGKIGNRDESGYNIAWLTNLAPYTGLENCEYMYVVEGCKHPAGARLFIRWVTGGEDGKSGGLKPFQKEGNWPVRSDVDGDWNPVSLPESGAIEPDLAAIYTAFPQARDLWTYWLSKSPNTVG